MELIFQPALRGYHFQQDRLQSNFAGKTRLASPVFDKFELAMAFWGRQALPEGNHYPLFGIPFVFMNGIGIESVRASRTLLICGCPKDKKADWHYSCGKICQLLKAFDPFFYRINSCKNAAKAKGRGRQEAYFRRLLQYPAHPCLFLFFLRFIEAGQNCQRGVLCKGCIMIYFPDFAKNRLCLQ